MSARKRYVQESPGKEIPWAEPLRLSIRSQRPLQKLLSSSCPQSNTKIPLQLPNVCAKHPNLLATTRREPYLSYNSHSGSNFSWHALCLPLFYYHRKRASFTAWKAGRDVQARHGLRICRNMSFVDLTKATVTCGGIAFLIYTFPALAQGLIIGLLSLLWLSYAHKTVIRWIRR